VRVPTLACSTVRSYARASYDPLAPGAIVMKRPDKAHQKKFNRRYVGAMYSSRPF
jgi:hypothetical protein